MDRAYDIRVRLFGLHRERVGAPGVYVKLKPGSTVADLKLALEGHPAIGASLGGTAVAVNQVYAPDDETIAEGDEVALIPPVAGG